MDGEYQYATDQVRRPILLNDPEQCWIVVQGGVDVFLIDKPGGARTTVMRLMEGKAFRGLSSVGTFTLLACPLPDTVLEPAGGERLNGVAGEEWLANLVDAASDSPSPTTHAVIRAGEEITAEGKPLIIRPALPFLWIEQLTGVSRFRGEAEFGLERDTLLPLPLDSWIEIQPGGRVAAHTQAPAAMISQALAGVRSLESFAFLSLLKRRAAHEQERFQQIQARRSHDTAALADSLLQLGDDEEANGIDVTLHAFSADPTMTVVHEIAKALRFPLHSPADLHSHASPEGKLGAIATASGVRTRQVLLRGSWWRRSTNPLVGFLEEDGLPVAILPRGNGFELFHPQSRVRTRVTKRQAQALRPSAFVFYRPFPHKALNAWSLLQFSLFRSERDAVTVLLLGFLGGALGMIVPIVTGVVFDSIIPGAERTQLFLLVLMVLSAAIATAILSLVRGIALLRIESRMSADVQAAVWDRLLSLPASFFRNFSSGDLAARSLGINHIRAVLTTSLTSSVLSVIFSVFSFGLLFYYDSRLALVATALTLLLAAFGITSSYRSAKVEFELAAIGGELSTLVLQFLKGLSKLRVAGAEGRAFALWSRLFSRQQSKRLAARRVQVRSAVFQSAFPVFSSMVIFYCVWHLSQTSLQPLSTGRFLAFISALGQFFGSALLFTWALQTAASAVPAYQRARPILQAAPEVDFSKAQPGLLSGAIELSQVGFSYREGAPPVLNGISLSIRAGQFVALVGHSGCGKSTLCRLLLGFEKPQNGAIYFDGQDLAGLDIQAVRKQIGSVLQSSGLMAGDLYRNIVGDLPLSVSDALEAARVAGLEEDIRNMPMGLHTLVGEGGVGLSGGQRQRIMIARAIVSRPPIILFDEATSALDNQTQLLVSQNLVQLRATRIVIAHRLSTVINADRIYFLHRGRVAEEGTYAELIEGNGLFTDFAKRQLAREGETTK